MSAAVLAVGILAHDEERSIGRMLRSLARQSAWRSTPSDRRQAVVYANGCRDRTADAARSLRTQMSEIEVIETEVRGKSLGWSALHAHLRPDAQWWLYADADVLLHWRAIERLLSDAEQHPEAAVVSSTLRSSARYLPPRRRGLLIAARVESERWKPQRREVSARLYAIRREVAEAIRLPPGVLNEDLYLTRVLGAERIWRSPRAWVFNREPQGARELVAYQVRTRIGSFQARRLRGERVDSNKTPRAMARRAGTYRRLSWRAWAGKLLWLPLRLYVEWKARRFDLDALGESFWIDVPGSKLVPRKRE